MRKGKIVGFLTNLFGGETNIWTISFGLLIVIVLIVLGVWLLKMLFNMSGSIARGRQRRLALVDTMAIDSKHNLVIVRHDNTEHLLVLSSTSATLVQANISAAEAMQISSNTAQNKDNAATTTAIGAGTAALAGTGTAAIVSKSPSSKAQPNVSAAQNSKDPQFGLARMLKSKPKGKQPEVAVDSSKNPSPQSPPPKSSSPKGAPSKSAKPKANEPKLDIPKAKAPDVITEKAQPNLQSSVTQLHPKAKNNEKPKEPPLRHTGLLVPVSEMVSANRVGVNAANNDKNEPRDADSAMNKAQQIDSDAMESIEEGANSGNDTANTKRSKAKSKPSKKTS